MLYIHGCGHFRPENIIDNKFLEDLDIGTTDEWILERVGIKSRQTVLPLDYIRQTKNINPAAAFEASLYTNGQTGSCAAKAALQVANLSKDEIGMLISGSCSPQHSCPAEACTIAAELDIEVPSFDLNSACSSIAAQLNFINMMSKKNLPDYILVVNPENNTRVVDYSDRNSAVLWGDCSSAMIVSKTIPSDFRITATGLESSPKGWEKVKMPTAAHFKQQGRTVQTFAIKRTLSLIKKMRELITVEKIKQVKFIGHQANLMMLNSVCNMAEISSDQHLYNVDEFGNCGAAGAPSVFSQNWSQINCGDVVMMAVVGAGLSFGSVLIERA